MRKASDRPSGGRHRDGIIASLLCPPSGPFQSRKSPKATNGPPMGPFRVGKRISMCTVSPANRHAQPTNFIPHEGGPVCFQKSGGPIPRLGEWWGSGDGDGFNPISNCAASSELTAREAPHRTHCSNLVLELREEYCFARFVLLLVFALLIYLFSSSIVFCESAWDPTMKGSI